MDSRGVQMKDSRARSSDGIEMNGMETWVVTTNNEGRGSGNVLLLGNRLSRGAGVLQEGAAT
jgi:hypothetical protein